LKKSQGSRRYFAKAHLMWRYAAENIKRRDAGNQSKRRIYTQN